MSKRPRGQGGSNSTSCTKRRLAENWLVQRSKALVRLHSPHYLLEREEATVRVVPKKSGYHVKSHMSQHQENLSISGPRLLKQGGVARETGQRWGEPGEL